MAKPVLVVVDDDGATLQALTVELESRYGVPYQVVSASSPEVALARLAELKAAGADVPLVLADQQMPGMSGTQLLARVRDIFPTARRGLLISWGDRSTPAPFLEAAALGQLEFYLETTTPGVFAAGDVRHGSIKRVASAVGDGSIAIRLIHDYLALSPQNAKGDEPRLRGQGAVPHHIRTA
jgi:CheY-like chemotaxis protein